MKKIIFIVLIFLIVSSKFTSAQITQLNIGVDGFTCSLCAKGVEEQFKSLDFVKSVKTDLENTTFQLSLKSSPKINVSQIKSAVEDGGFSLRDITIVAKGIIKGNQSSGYTLTTQNAPDMNLKGLKQDFSEGDKVLVKGKVNAESNSLDVTTIKKM